eukprot:COSAG05_NODE_3102_length_2321_cov_1.380288_2_plen_261_part_00
MVQLEGAKTWRLFAPLVRTPRRYQKVKLRRAELGPLQRTVTLQAGDVLYVPAGVPHECVAVSSDDGGSGASLHATFGVEVSSAVSVEGALQLINEQYMPEAEDQEGWETAAVALALHGLAGEQQQHSGLRRAALVGAVQGQQCSADAATSFRAALGDAATTLQTPSKTMEWVDAAARTARRALAGGAMAAPPSSAGGLALLEEEEAADVYAREPRLRQAAVQFVRARMRHGGPDRGHHLAHWFFTREVRTTASTKVPFCK